MLKTLFLYGNIRILNGELLYHHLSINSFMTVHFDTKDCNILVVQTGYIGRLCKWDGSDEENLLSSAKELKEYDLLSRKQTKDIQENPHKYIDDYEEDEIEDDKEYWDEEFFIFAGLTKLLYIKDSLWGQGLMRLHTSQKFIDKIENILLSSKIIQFHKDGYLVYKVGSFQDFQIINKRMEEKPFCANFGIIDIEIVHEPEQDLKIAIIEYDTESG